MALLRVTCLNIELKGFQIFVCEKKGKLKLLIVAIA